MTTLAARRPGRSRAGGLPADRPGREDGGIAERLHLSVKTVETYRDRIRQKLDLSDGTELAHYATQWVLENG